MVVAGKNNRKLLTKICYKKINLRHLLILLYVLSVSLCGSISAQGVVPIKLSTPDSLLKIKELKFNSLDGPYVYNDSIYRITSKKELTAKKHTAKDSILVEVANKHKDSFYVSLGNAYKIPPTNYNMPNKLLVISDIEGNYNGFAGFLMANKVIDKHHNWIFGDGHLVLVGDFVDRGKNVRPVLWLIYKLEFQAKKAQGTVHFILGNHEVLNFEGNFKYNNIKYIKVAQKLSGFKDKQQAVKQIYSSQFELGKWLSTKNVVEKIGNYVFVHGGLSPELLQYKLSFQEINNAVRKEYAFINPDRDYVTRFLYSAKGPFWYRGLVMNRLNYLKIKPKELDQLLEYYRVKKIVIGHSPVDNVSLAYQGKVIRLDVVHGPQKFSGKTKGLIIENNTEFIIDDIGNKTPLQ